MSTARRLKSQRGADVIRVVIGQPAHPITTPMTVSLA